MTTQAILSGFLALLIGIVVYLSAKLGKKTAQLEAAKRKKRKKKRKRPMLKKSLMLFTVCLLTMLVGSCKSYQTSNASVCQIPFDYGDKGVNDTNARGLLIYYCLCKDETPCKK